MKNQKPAVRWHGFLTTLPAVSVALLPRLTCPCQIPAYAGLIGSMGLTFLMKTVYLFPLTAMCLTFAVGGLAIRAKRRRGYAPFAVGLLGASVLMFGKFVIAWDLLVHGGVVLLLAASVWNSWPSERKEKFRFNPDGSVEAGRPSASA